MKKSKQKIVETKVDIMVLTGLILIFGYFFIGHPVQELSDSHQYLNQFVSREPVYALLLQLLQVCFGEQYGIALGLLQNVLAVLCIYWLYKRLNYLMRFPIVLQPLTALILLSPHLITPLAAKSGMIITNSVLTEGVAISLYYVWFGILLSVLLDFYKEKQKKYEMISLLLSVLLSMIRGQLIICILVWLIVTVFVAFREKSYRKICLIFLCFLLSFAAKTELTKIYNYAESGFYVNTVASKPMLLANILYVADMEDGDVIQDEKLRAAFEQALTGVKQAGLSRDQAVGNILDLADFHEAGHEIINFDYIVPSLNAYIKEKDGVDEGAYLHLLVLQEEYAGQMVKAVMPRVLPEFIKNYLVIASLGFIRSIAVDRGILPIYAVIAYLTSLLLMGLLLIRNRRSSSALFMACVLILICGTVFGTSIMIECISRYMVYNLPLFYIAGLGMLMELYDNRDRKDK